MAKREKSTPKARGTLPKPSRRRGALKPSHGCHSDRVHPPLLVCASRGPSPVTPRFPSPPPPVTYPRCGYPPYHQGRPTRPPAFPPSSLLTDIRHRHSRPASPFAFCLLPSTPVDTASADIKLRYQLPRRQTTARSPAMNLRIGARVLRSLSDEHCEARARVNVRAAYPRCYRRAAIWHVTREKLRDRFNPFPT